MKTFLSKNLNPIDILEPMSIRIKREISSKSLNRLERAGTLTSLENIFADIDDELDDSEIEGGGGGGELYIEYHNVSRRIFFKDLFYSIIQFRFWILFLIIIASICFFMFISSLVYYGVSDDCGLHIHEKGYTAEAFLYAILIQFRIVMNPTPGTNFWNGCVGGISGLFFQLFIGNILMSLLISSLVFSFQSISRRGRSTKFSQITLGQVGRVVAAGSFCGEISIPVADTNRSRTSDGGKNKISNCSATVYVFDGSQSTVSCIASSIPLFPTLPTELRFKIPSQYIFPKDHPAAVFESDPSCRVCGKPCDDFGRYLCHLRACDDTQHDIEYENISESIAGNDEITSAMMLKKISSKQLQFIVLVEGSDPITTDRLQVQKIYTPSQLVGENTPSSVRVVERGPSGEAIINYESFF
jgi:hypothetical protein